MASHDQKINPAHHLNYLYLTNTMMPFMIPLASYNATLVLMASHDQKHIVSDFDHLGVKNGMVPLMTPLASCDTDNSTNDII